jgi:hypothetical protein
MSTKRKGKVTPIESIISAEVTKQLFELKEQLNKELIEDMKILHQRVSREMIDVLTTMIDEKLKTHTNNSLSVIGEQNELVKLNEQMQQVYTAVNSNMMKEINEKVMPKINNMANWVRYNTQDTGEMIDSYRRAVEHQSRTNVMAITDGTNDTRVISPYVRTFFGEKD